MDTCQIINGGVSDKWCIAKLVRSRPKIACQIIEELPCTKEVNTSKVRI